MRIRRVMPFSISDLLKIIQIIISMFFSWIKRKSWQSKSLLADLLKYYEELKNDLFEGNEPKTIETKTLLWEVYSKIQKDKPSIKDVKTIAKTNNIFKFWLKEYLKNGEYSELLEGLKIKFYSYIGVLVECIKDYWEWNERKLRKERRLFDEYFIDNLLELKKAYIDLMISILHPEFDDQQRIDTIDKIVDKINFEKYIPIVQKFLNKVDDRVI